MTRCLFRTTVKPNRRWHAVLLVSGALALAGCATDQLRVGRASAMVTAGRAATAGSRALIDGSFDSNRRFIVDLASLDPTCDLPAPRLALGPDAWGGCVAATDPRGVTLTGPSQVYAKLSIASINGIVAYLDAIDSIATRKPIDIAGSLTTARDDLSSAIDQINTVTGAGLTLPVTSAQLGAAKDLLDLLSGMISAARQARDLKRVESDLDAAKFDTSLARLREVTQAWTLALKMSVEQEGLEIDGARDLKITKLRALCPMPRPIACAYEKLDAADRLEARLLAERKLAVLDLKPRTDALGDKVTALLTAFETAHKDYRQLLLDPRNARLTPAEKARRAAIIREQIIAAIRGVIAIVAVI